ncbi:S8 family peptidase [Paenibacillus sp. J2TS4]|uniref:S8 family peptidase n=1 Tax=Paenibacillus sp. J2TS4 TaxID=2807194 RepID=UPI001AFEFBA2|nr:S8 family peptidase [Paenibacillus sp. J2TS4]GIP36554.1 hypothetical protein J2TS4_57640 [Paenibacillus sp. J2TS4]
MERDLIHWILDELQNGGTDSSRHIIRFKTQEDYLNCLRLMGELMPSLECPPFLQPLPAIQGFSCFLRPPQGRNPYSERISIEEDSKQAFVHAYPSSSLRSRTTAKFRLDEQLVPWGVRQIKAPSAWARSTGHRIKIAVIDTGIDYLHPDLQRNVAGGVNVIYRHLPPRDDNGHGTHISGTIAASSTRKGIVGVSPNASLYAVKAFDHNGTAFISDIIFGIEWCIRNKIDIINMSFGMKNYSKALEDTIHKAYEAGVIVVASSGNDGRTGRIDYPARFTTTIAVGATTRNKKIARFSNRGKSIDIYAPGDKVYSSWLNGKYNELSGTSMATSHVSGVIAMMMALRGKMPHRTVKELLKQSSSTIQRKRSTSSVTGELNALQAVRSVLS